MHNPYPFDQKVNLKGKLVADIVGHIPKEISRVARFFSEHAGKTNGKVFEEKYWHFPIPKDGIEIMLSTELRISDNRRNSLESFKEIIQNNYLENTDPSNCQINYLTVINLQNESFAELQEDEDK